MPVYAPINVLIDRTWNSLMSAVEFQKYPNIDKLDLKDTRGGWDHYSLCLKHLSTPALRLRSTARTGSIPLSRLGMPQILAQYFPLCTYISGRTPFSSHD